MFVAIDCGYGREGVDVTRENYSPLVSLARAVQRSPWLSLAGLYSHSGNAYNTPSGRAGAKEVALLEAQRAGRAATAVRAAGIPVAVVSVGSTPSVCAPASLKPLADAGATEVHPGNYTLLDRQQVASGSVKQSAAGPGQGSARLTAVSSSSSSTLAEPAGPVARSVDPAGGSTAGALSTECVGSACHVLATVLSHYPDRNEALVNAGGTALHKDSGGVEHWGELRGFGGRIVVLRLSQEHGVIGTLDGSPMPWTELPLGGVVRIVPNHSCMAACQHQTHHVVGEGGVVEDVWRPAAGW